jgi:hypothetical protein
VYANDRPTYFVDPTGHIVREAWGIDEAQGFWSAFGKNLAYNALTGHRRTRGRVGCNRGPRDGGS